MACLAWAGSGAPWCSDSDEMKIKDVSSRGATERRVPGHVEVIFPRSHNKIEYLWKLLREKRFPHLAIWSWWLPQSCSPIAPQCGKTPKSALLGFYTAAEGTQRRGWRALVQGSNTSQAACQRFQELDRSKHHVHSGQNFPDLSVENYWFCSQFQFSFIEHIQRKAGWETTRKLLNDDSDLAGDLDMDVDPVWTCETSLAGPGQTQIWFEA